MSVARKILSNTAFQILGKAVTAGLSIIVVKLITGYLGTVGYGQYTTVYEFLAFFGIVADLGLYTIAVREMSNDREQIPYIIGNILGIRTILVVLTMAAATIAAFVIPQYQGSVIPIGVAIAAVGTTLTILNGTIASVLQVHLKMELSTIGLILGKIVSVSYMAFVVFFLFPNDIEMGFYHLMVAGIIGNGLMMLITLKYTSGLSPIRYRFDWQFWKDVFLKALPYGIALFLNTIYFRVDTILMSFLLPSEFAGVCKQGLCANEQIGLYGVAMRMTEVILIIPVYFMNSVLPVLTEYIKEGSDKVRILLQYTFDFIVMMALPIVVGGYLLAYPIIYIISKPEFLSKLDVGFYGSDIALRLLLFAMLFAFLNSMFGILLVVVNQQMKLLYINAGCVIFNILANIAVIPVYGFRGAAMTSILSEFIILIATYLAARRYMDLHLRLTRTFKMLISVGAMGFAVYFLHAPTFELFNNKNIILLIPIGGLVYGGMLFATGAINKQMLALLKKH